MARKEKKETEWISWGLIVLLFIVGLSPFALVLLFIKLFASDGKKKQTAPPPLQTQSAYQRGSAQPPRQSKAKSAVQKVTKSPVEKKSTAKRLKIIGAVMAVLGVAACYDPIDMMIWMGSIESYYV